MRKMIFLLVAVLVIAGCTAQGESDGTPTTQSGIKSSTTSAAIPTTTQHQQTTLKFSSGEKITIMNTRSSDVDELVWSPDSRILYTSALYLIAFDPKTGSEIARGEYAGRTISVSSDGKYVLTNGKVFDAKTLFLVKKLDAGPIGSFSPDSMKVAVTSPLGTEIRIFDTTTWEKISEFSNLQAISNIQWSKDGKNLYIGKSVIDSSTGSVVKNFESIGLHSGKYSPDGSKIGLVTGQTKLDTFSIYDSKTFNSLTEFKIGWLSTWGWSPDGKYVLTNNGEIWDTSGKKVLGDIYPNNILYLVSSWSPDGKMIALGTGNLISIFEKA